MCSGNRNTTALRSEQTRLGNISKIKSQQAARKSKINVVTGSKTKDYKRSISTGAKRVGMSAADTKKLKMSKLFSKRMGAGAFEAMMLKMREKTRKLLSGGGGGNATSSDPIQSGGGKTIGSKGAFGGWGGGDTSGGIGMG